MKKHFPLIVFCSILLSFYGVTAVKTQLLSLDTKITEQKNFLQKFDEQNRSYQSRLTTELGHDVAVGKDGTYWIVGSKIGGVGGFEIYRWDKTNDKWEQIAGSAVRISVDSEGKAWIVNKLGHVLKYTGGEGGWLQISGTGNDIGAGADGSVWLVGVDGSLYKLNADKISWQEIEGQGMRIAVDPTGKPWIVNDKKEIYRYTGSGWERMPGEAVDIGIGSDGTVVISGGEKTDTGYQTLKWNADNKQWTVMAGLNSKNVSVDPDGEAFVADGELVIRKSGEDTTAQTGNSSSTSSTETTTQGGTTTRTTTTRTTTTTTQAAVPASA